MVDYDLVIIGAGPAGMNACLYASRANLKTLVIEKNCPGGKMIKASKIENWLSSKEIGGADLALEMFKHAFSFNGEYLQGNVVDIINCNNYKEVVLENKKITCYAVIVATGTSERKLGIKGEEKFYGKGVSYCTVCDAPLYKDKSVAVLGNSKSIFEDILYLTKFAKVVYYLNEKENINYNFEKENKIKVINKCKLVSINGENNVSSLTILVDNNIQNIDVSCVFPLYGDVPDTMLTSKLNLLNDNRYVVVNNKQETLIEGIYAAGDCTDNNLKQIITACSSGAVAATQAYKYINKIKAK